MVTLDPCRVLRWAIDNFHWDVPADALVDREKARACITQTDRDREHVLGLLHTLTHMFLNMAYVASGYDHHALAEKLLPDELSAVIFLNPRKAAASGGLQALIQRGLHVWLNRATNAALTCPYDPHCSDHGGYCPGCIALPRGCLTFNAGISRAYLVGGTLRSACDRREVRIKGFWD